MMKNKVNEIRKELDKLLGHDENFLDIVFGLKKLLNVTKISNKKQDKIIDLLCNLNKSNKNSVEKLIKLAEGLRKIVPEVTVKLPKVIETTVRNQPQFPKKIKVSNFPKFPEEIKLKKPAWLKIPDLSSLLEKLDELANKVFRVRVINTDPKKPIAVRLSNGRYFYNALFEVVSAGGGTGFESPTGERVSARVTQRGTKWAVAVEVVDGSGNQITSFSVDDDYPSGSGDEENLTLANADTAYAVPSSAPTKKYVLVCYNGSDTDMYWSYKNSTSGGVILEAGEKVALDLGANQQIYFWCGSAGKVLNCIWKEVE